MNLNGAPRSLVKFRKLTQITKIMQDNSSEGFHPPKPRLTLRIGITGHRPNKLSGSAAERIKTQLERVFSAIEEAANRILKANATIYANELPQLRLVSAFAEGADQLAVSVSPSNWMIDGILPFPKDEYLRDFSNSALGDNRDVRSEFLDCLGKASNVTQFPFPRRHKREQGYLNSGSYLLRQIDILISIWDGTPPKPGGTGAIAKEAYEGGIPVVWLSTLGDDVPRLITGFDEKSDPIAPETDCTEGPLLSALKPIFDGPSPRPGHSRRSPLDALNVFYHEVWHPRCYFSAYDFLIRVANLRRPRAVIRSRSFAEQCADWESFFAAAPQVINLTERLRQVLLPRFIWADALAVHFAHLYRSAYVLAYFLSAVAVFIGLFGVFAPHIDQKVFIVFAEFVVVGAIIALIFLGRHYFWHERWLDYRALAESLRHGRFLAFVSEFGRIHEKSRKAIWTSWYIRATMRELGLPSALLDSTYQWRILDATSVCEIEKQIEYHKLNQQIIHRVDHLLHGMGIACFVITFIVLLIFLIGYADERLFAQMRIEHPVTALGYVTFFLKPWMVICTAGLPALGAALTSIRVHGEFESSEQRSAAMIDSLTTLKDDYAAAMRREVDLEDTAQRLISASRVMSKDLSAWGELYGRKRLVLPS